MRTESRRLDRAAPSCDGCRCQAALLQVIDPQEILSTPARAEGRRRRIPRAVAGPETQVDGGRPRFARLDVGQSQRAMSPKKISRAQHLTWSVSSSLRCGNRRCCCDTSGAHSRETAQKPLQSTVVGVRMDSSRSRCRRQGRHRGSAHSAGSTAHPHNFGTPEWSNFAKTSYRFYLVRRPTIPWFAVNPDHSIVIGAIPDGAKPPQYKLWIVELADMLSDTLFEEEKRPLQVVYRARLDILGSERRSIDFYLMYRFDPFKHTSSVSVAPRKYVPIARKPPS